MYTLVVRCELFDAKRRLYVLKNTEKVEAIGVNAEDFDEIAFALIHKYNIKHINLSGARMYMEGIEKQLKEAGINTYSVDDLSFKYV